MPYTLVHNGLTREFDFYAPTGWEHWVGKAWEKGRVGLPLVVALHGGAQDPLDFQEKWFFPRTWNLAMDADGNPADPVPIGGDRVLENQFFVLYPYGTGWTTATLSLLAYGMVEPAEFPHRWRVQTRGRCTVMVEACAVGTSAKAATAGRSTMCPSSVRPAMR